MQYSDDILHTNRILSFYRQKSNLLVSLVVFPSNSCYITFDWHIYRTWKILKHVGYSKLNAKLSVPFHIYICVYVYLCVCVLVYKYTHTYGFNFRYIDHMHSQRSMYLSVLFE